MPLLKYFATIGTLDGAALAPRLCARTGQARPVEASHCAGRLGCWATEDDQRLRAVARCHCSERAGHRVARQAGRNNDGETGAACVPS